MIFIVICLFTLLQRHNFCSQLDLITILEGFFGMIGKA